MHIHPFFAIFGALSCYLLMLWLVPSAIYVGRRWKRTSALDAVMILSALLAAFFIIVPDKFFA